MTELFRNMIGWSADPPVHVISPTEIHKSPTVQTTAARLDRPLLPLPPNPLASVTNNADREQYYESMRMSHLREGRVPTGSKFVGFARLKFADTDFIITTKKLCIGCQEKPVAESNLSFNLGLNMDFDMDIQVDQTLLDGHLGLDLLEDNSSKPNSNIVEIFPDAKEAGVPTSLNSQDLTADLPETGAATNSLQPSLSEAGQSESLLNDFMFDVNTENEETPHLDESERVPPTSVHGPKLNYNSSVVEDVDLMELFKQPNESECNLLADFDTANMDATNVDISMADFTSETETKLQIDFEFKTQSLIESLTFSTSMAIDSGFLAPFINGEPFIRASREGGAIGDVWQVAKNDRNSASTAVIDARAGQIENALGPLYHLDEEMELGSSYSEEDSSSEISWSASWNHENSSDSERESDSYSESDDDEDGVDSADPFLSVHGASGKEGGPAISERHIQLFYDSDRQVFAMHVLGETGALINDDFVPQDSTRPLYHGDIITIGTISFTFQLPKSVVRRMLRAAALMDGNVLRFQKPANAGMSLDFRDSNGELMVCSSSSDEEGYYDYAHAEVFNDLFMTSSEDGFFSTDDEEDDEDSASDDDVSETGSFAADQAENDFRDYESDEVYMGWSRTYASSDSDVISSKPRKFNSLPSRRPPGIRVVPDSSSDSDLSDLDDGDDSDVGVPEFLPAPTRRPVVQSRPVHAPGPRPVGRPRKDSRLIVKLKVPSLYRGSKKPIKGTAKEVKMKLEREREKEREREREREREQEREREADRRTRDRENGLVKKKAIKAKVGNGFAAYSQIRASMLNKQEKQQQGRELQEDKDCGRENQHKKENGVRKELTKCFKEKEKDNNDLLSDKFRDRKGRERDEVSGTKHSRPKSPSCERPVKRTKFQALNDSELEEDSVLPKGRRLSDSGIKSGGKGKKVSQTRSPDISPSLVAQVEDMMAMDSDDFECAIMSADDEDVGIEREEGTEAKDSPHVEDTPVQNHKPSEAKRSPTPVPQIPANPIVPGSNVATVAPPSEAAAAAAKEALLSRDKPLINGVDVWVDGLPMGCVIPARHSGPGRPPKDGLLSKREKSQIKRMYFEQLRELGENVEMDREHGNAPLINLTPVSISTTTAAAATAKPMFAETNHVQMGHFQESRQEVHDYAAAEVKDEFRGRARSRGLSMSSIHSRDNIPMDPLLATGSVSTATIMNGMAAVAAAVGATVNPISGVITVPSSVMDAQQVETNGFPGSANGPVVIPASAALKEKDKDKDREREKDKPSRRERTPSPVMKIEHYSPSQLARPSASYLVIIYDILSSSPVPLNLRQIYTRMMTAYPYFRFEAGSKGWQSSVRHNLAQNKCFVKAFKDGKGYAWSVDPRVDVFKDRKRRGSSPETGGKDGKSPVRMSVVGGSVPIYGVEMGIVPVRGEIGSSFFCINPFREPFAGVEGPTTHFHGSVDPIGNVNLNEMSNFGIVESSTKPSAAPPTVATSRQHRFHLHSASGSAKGKETIWPEPDNVGNGPPRLNNRNIRVKGSLSLLARQQTVYGPEFRAISRVVRKHSTKKGRQGGNNHNASTSGPSHGGTHGHSNHSHINHSQPLGQPLSLHAQAHAQSQVQAQVQAQVEAQAQAHANAHAQAHQQQQQQQQHQAHSGLISKGQGGSGAGTVLGSSAQANSAPRQGPNSGSASGPASQSVSACNNNSSSTGGSSNSSNQPPTRQGLRSDHVENGLRGFRKWFLDMSKDDPVIAARIIDNALRVIRNPGEQLIHKMNNQELELARTIVLVLLDHAVDALPNITLAAAVANGRIPPIQARLPAQGQAPAQPQSHGSTTGQVPVQGAGRGQTAPGSAVSQAPVLGSNQGTVGIQARTQVSQQPSQPPVSQTPVTTGSNSVRLIPNAPSKTPAGHASPKEGPRQIPTAPSSLHSSVSTLIPTSVSKSAATPVCSAGAPTTIPGTTISLTTSSLRPINSHGRAFPALTALSSLSSPQEIVSQIGHILSLLPVGSANRLGLAGELERVVEVLKADAVAAADAPTAPASNMDPDFAKSGGNENTNQNGMSGGEGPAFAFKPVTVAPPEAVLSAIDGLRKRALMALQEHNQAQQAQSQSQSPAQQTSSQSHGQNAGTRSNATPVTSGSQGSSRHTRLATVNWDGQVGTAPMGAMAPSLASTSSRTANTDSAPASASATGATAPVAPMVPSLARVPASTSSSSLSFPNPETTGPVSSHVSITSATLSSVSVSAPPSAPTNDSPSPSVPTASTMPAAISHFHPSRPNVEPLTPINLSREGSRVGSISRGGSVGRAASTLHGVESGPSEPNTVSEPGKTAGSHDYNEMQSHLSQKRSFLSVSCNSSTPSLTRRPSATSVANKGADTLRSNDDNDIIMLDAFDNDFHNPNKPGTGTV